MNLIELANVSKAVRERMTSDFRLVLDYLAYRNNPKEMKKFMGDNNRVIRHQEEFLDTMSELASDGRYKTIKNQIMEKFKSGSEKEELTMWKIEDEIENRGIQQGIQRGESRVNRLIEILAQQNRMDEIVRAAGDKEFQKKLFKEFQL